MGRGGSDVPEPSPRQVAGVLGVALAGLKRRLERGSDGGCAARLGHDTEFLEIINGTCGSGILPLSQRHRLEAAATRTSAVPFNLDSSVYGAPDVVNNCTTSWANRSVAPLCAWAKAVAAWEAVCRRSASVTRA